ncbi:MAG: nucleotide exchange factor GrpE [Bacteroidales bacterium]|nr:nucleotide exchange factor GrpE [Bacteroidales bacterium]
MADKDKETKQAPVKKEPKTPKNKPSKEEELQKKVVELTDKLSAEHGDYLRLMAEFETFRRRSAEERLNMVSTASADTIKGLLPVLDDCERALQVLEKSSDSAAREGTALIYNKLMAYLKTRGLEVIEAKGKKFDIDFHEAVAQIPAPSEQEKGLVLDVVQTGYMLSGKILRYAKVVVGA